MQNIFSFLSSRCLMAAILSSPLLGCGGEETEGPPSQPSEVFPIEALDGFTTVMPNSSAPVDVHPFLRGALGHERLTSVEPVQAKCSEVTLSEDGTKFEVDVPSGAWCDYRYTVENKQADSPVSATISVLATSSLSPKLPPISQALQVGGPNVTLNITALLGSDFPTGYQLDGNNIVVQGENPGSVSFQGGNVLIYTLPNISGWNRIVYTLSKISDASDTKIGELYITISEEVNQPPNIGVPKLVYPNPISVNSPITIDLKTVGANITDPNNGQDFQLISVKSISADVAAFEPNSVTNTKFTFQAAKNGNYVVSYIVGDHYGGFSSGLIRFTVGNGSSGSGDSIIVPTEPSYASNRSSLMDESKIKKFIELTPGRRDEQEGLALMNDGTAQFWGKNAKPGNMVLSTNAKDVFMYPHYFGVLTNDDKLLAFDLGGNPILDRNVNNVDRVLIDNSRFVKDWNYGNVVVKKDDSVLVYDDFFNKTYNYHIVSNLKGSDIQDVDLCGPDYSLAVTTTSGFIEIYIKDIYDPAKKQSYFRDTTIPPIDVRNAKVLRKKGLSSGCHVIVQKPNSFTVHFIHPTNAVNVGYTRYYSKTVSESVEKIIFQHRHTLNGPHQYGTTDFYYYLRKDGTVGGKFFGTGRNVEEAEPQDFSAVKDKLVNVKDLTNSFGTFIALLGNGDLIAWDGGYHYSRNVVIKNVDSVYVDRSSGLIFVVKNGKTMAYLNHSGGYDIFADVPYRTIDAIIDPAQVYYGAEGKRGIIFRDMKGYWHWGDSIFLNRGYLGEKVKGLDLVRYLNSRTVQFKRPN